LVACIHPPASQHQHSSSSSSWGSTGDDCWMLEVLETAVLYLLSRVVVVACVCFAPQCSLRISAPTVPLRPVVFSWHCAPCAPCGFLWLLLCVWPLPSGHSVQHLSVHVSAFVVCVAIAKWSQGAAVCLFMCQTQPAFYPLFAALKSPLLALLPRGCFKTCPRPYFGPACGPSCCGAVRGLRCSCRALASSWSPLVPFSFFGVGLMDSPLSTLLHPFISLRFVAA
jgi:hypothetical protein